MAKPEWEKLAEGTRETCASERCKHAPASWRMEAGGLGSFFCHDCYRVLTSVWAEHDDDDDDELEHDCGEDTCCCAGQS